MKKLSILLTLFLSGIQLFAQSFTIKSLPLDSIHVINAIAVDASGTCWFGTEKGLLSITKNHQISLLNAHTSPSDTTKITAISSLFIDKQQNKWIGTYTGQVYKLTPQGIFEKYDFSKFGEGLITNILIDKNNNIWVSTAGNGLYTMNSSGDMMNLTAESSSLPSNQVFALNLDNQGNMWIGTAKGLTKLSGINNWDKEKKIEGEVSAMAEYNGDLWVGVVGIQETEIWKYESYRKWVKIELPNFLRYTRFMEFVFDKNGKLWAATNKITNLDNGMWNLYGDETGLMSNSTTSLHFDQDNNLWVGSDGKGLYTTANIIITTKENTKTPIVSFIEEKKVAIPESDGLNPELADDKLLDKAIKLNIQFEQSKAELLPISIIELEKLVEILVRNPAWQVEIGGHTDNVGNPKLNQQLSEQRANIVRDYLVQRDINRQRISTVGYGGSMPLANNGDLGNREKNRRVEVILRKK
jgi:outer membrane protein OmpA-like peptidoglycan-associated protein/streptogramin lyase